MNIITKFPEPIQQRLDEGKFCYSSIGQGWLPLVVDLDEKLAELYPDYTINQIKEKFGSLRYYANGIGDDGWELIHEAEKLSSTTCEVCGEPGTLISKNGWFRTRCEKHKDD